MSTTTTESLKQHYEKKYGKPKTDEQAIAHLSEAYQDLLKPAAMTMAVKEGIGEYFRMIKERDLPAFEWMLEVFHQVSKKEQGKRNFSYCVGMIRSWMKFGFGHIPSQEEEDIIEYFEESVGDEISLEARKIVRTLMGKYGVIKVTRMIGELRHSKDMSKIYAILLSLLLEEKYDNIEPMDLNDVTKQKINESA